MQQLSHQLHQIQAQVSKYKLFKKCILLLSQSFCIKLSNLLVHKNVQISLRNLQNTIKKKKGNKGV